MAGRFFRRAPATALSAVLAVLVAPAVLAVLAVLAAPVVLATLAAPVPPPPSAEAEPPAPAGPCATDRFEGARYTVCTADPRTADLRVFWRNTAGLPFRTFSAVAEAVGAETPGTEKHGAETRRLAFAVNAGMYDADFAPVGLYVEDGRTLRPANTARVEGPPGQVPNFYKMPNGVFFLAGTGGERRAGILSTEAFLRAGL